MRVLARVDEALGGGFPLGSALRMGFGNGQKEFRNSTFVPQV